MKTKTRASELNDQQVSFFRELADLMEKYDNVCLVSLEKGEHSSAGFQFGYYDQNKIETVDIRRCHSSPYEIRLFAGIHNEEKSKWAQPTVIDDATLAFPASVMDLMPSREEIPREFSSPNGSSP